MAKLVIMSGAGAGEEFAFDQGATLGRSEDCEITLPGPLVSRRHARVSQAEDGYRIQDLGSANGTVVNGRTVARAALRDGDWVAIGDRKLTFLVDEDYSPPRAASLMDSHMPTVVGTLSVDEEEARAGGAPDASLRPHLEALQAVAEASCGTLETEDLLRLVLHELLRVYPQAEDAHVVLLGHGPGGDELCLSISRGGGASPYGMSRTVLQAATEKQEAILARDIGSDERLGGAQSLVERDLHSIMCCPLTARARSLGALQVDTTRADPFTREDLQLLVTVARQVAVAAENARLHARIVHQQRLAAMGQAVSNVAHCIKNVLNGLHGGSYILDLGLQYEEAEKVSKGWDMVKRNIGFISQLSQDMLAYCRGGGLQREPTRIPRLLGEVRALVAQSAADRQVEISVDAPEKMPPISADPVALKRAVLNLVSNAVDACEGGGRVELRGELDQSAEQVVVTVEDDGPGIEQQTQERLFEPFFTTKGKSGSGLGLAMVRKVAEEHNGRVELRSEPGRGAAFSIRLPAETAGQETELES